MWNKITKHCTNDEWKTVLWIWMAHGRPFFINAVVKSYLKTNQYFCEKLWDLWNVVSPEAKQLPICSVGFRNKNLVILWFHKWHDLKSLPSTLSWWWQWIYCINEVFQKVVFAIYSTLWIYDVVLARFNLLIHFARFKFLLKNKERVANITCIRFRWLATRQQLYATSKFSNDGHLSKHSQALKWFN